MTATHQQSLLVTGASGQLGRRVIELLLDANAGHIIATTRSPDKLADLTARGVDVRQADFDDPGSLIAAFAGADRLLLISTDVLDGTDRRQAQHRNAIAAAEQAGVKHVLYTSFVRTEPGNPAAVAPDHYATEQALAASSLGWTVLRNNVYTDMFLMGLPRAVASGQLIAATGTGGAGYVTREDCARAAAAALAARSAGRTTLDITGPAVVTYAELAEILSAIAERPITYVPIEPEAMVAGMVSAGLPEPVARMLVSFDSAVAQGALAVASSAVADLTGSPPQSVADFLRAHRDVLLAPAS
jgi:NAD(P)H dehydrogenase (quinone)